MQKIRVIYILLGLMGRIVKRCVMEVSLAQVSCILMYVYVAPPTPVGAWSMALGLRQRFEYYYYYYYIIVFPVITYLQVIISQSTLPYAVLTSVRIFAPSLALP